MYSDFFGLRCLPFQDRADTQFYFPTPELEETLASLQYEAHFGSGSALVLGEAGTGKTMLIRAFLPRLDKTDYVIVLTCPPGGVRDVIREVCKGFGVSVPTSRNQTRRISRLHRYLNRLAATKQRAVVVIDQAEHLNSSNLAQVSALSDVEGARGRLLRIILVAQPQIRTLLNRPELARIRQQFFGERTITSLTQEQTRAYVLHRLRVAGVAERELFDEDALRKVHEISQGIPRLINRVCNATLLAAYGAGAVVVTAAMVADAAGQQALCERTTPAESLGLASNRSIAAPWSQACFEPRCDAVENEPTDDGPEPLACMESTSITDVARGLGSAADFEPYADSEAAPTSGPNQALARQLERSVAKAERLAVTTEASLTQLMAVERHLATLLDRAEAVSGGMGPAVKRGVEAFEQAQQRLIDTVQRADQRTSSLETHASRLNESTQRMQETVLRSERAASSASEIESRLSQTAERFADQADEVQTRFTRLMEGLEKAAQSQSQTQRLIEQGERVRVALGRQVEDSQAAIAEQTSGLGREAAQELETFRNALHARGRESETLIQAAVEQAAAKTAGIHKVVADAVKEAEARMTRIAGEAIEDAQGKLDAILKQAATAKIDADARVTAQTEKLTSALAEAQRFESRFVQTTLEQARNEWHDLVQTATADMNRIRTQVDEVSSVKIETDSAVERAMGEARTMEDRIGTFAATLRQQEQALAGLSTRAAGLEGWKDTLDRAETAILELRGGRNQLEELRTDVAAVCAEANSTDERVTALREQMREMERFAAESRLDRAAVQGTTQSLRDAADSAKAVLAQLERTQEQVAGSQDAFSRDLDEARGVCTEIRTLVDAAATVTDRTSESVHQAREEARLSREQTEKLLAARTRADATSSALESLTKSAEHHLGALSGMVAHADEKVSRLGSHLASASSFVDRLSTAATTASRSITELDRAHESAARSTLEVQTKIAAMIEELGALTTRTEFLSNELAGRYSASQEQHRRLVEATESAGETGATLNSAEARARETIQAVVEQQDKTGRLAERLSGLADALAKAAVLQTSLAQTVARADTLGERLESLSAETTPKVETLRLAAETAATVSDRLLQAREEAASNILRLEGVISASAQRLDHADSTTAEIAGRTDQLQRDVERIAGGIASLTDELSAAAARPTEVLASVQAQTRQLEQVCAAVRKVFAALSQATLEAQREGEELRKVGREAGERWSELSAHTTRAGETLREWAEEAARAQARLERTLAECPPIQRTHPNDALRGVTQVLDRYSAGETPPPTLFAGASRISTPSDADAIDRPHRGSRTDEIARLIAEAKHAEAATRD